MTQMGKFAESDHLRNWRLVKSLAASERMPWNPERKLSCLLVAKIGDGFGALRDAANFMARVQLLRESAERASAEGSSNQGEAAVGAPVIKIEIGTGKAEIEALAVDISALEGLEPLLDELSLNYHEALAPFGDGDYLDLYRAQMDLRYAGGLLLEMELHLQKAKAVADQALALEMLILSRAKFGKDRAAVEAFKAKPLRQFAVVRKPFTKYGFPAIQFAEGLHCSIDRSLDDGTVGVGALGWLVSFTESEFAERFDVVTK